MQTIDISPSTTQHLHPQSWKEVASLHGVTAKTIERDREALDRLDDPITADLLEEIRRLRQWVSLGKGGGKFSRPTYLKLRRSSNLEKKLSELGII